MAPMAYHTRVKIMSSYTYHIYSVEHRRGIVEDIGHEHILVIRFHKSFHIVQSAIDSVFKCVKTTTSY